MAPEAHSEMQPAAVRRRGPLRGTPRRAALALVAGGLCAPGPLRASVDPAPGVAVQPPVTSVALSDVDGLLEELLGEARDAARIALVPIEDADAARAGALEGALLRGLSDRGGMEVVTPATLREGFASVSAQGEPDFAALRSLSADHVLLGRVLDAGGQVRLALRLVRVDSGLQVAQAQRPIEAPAAKTSVYAPSAEQTLRVLADGLRDALEALPGEIRYQRIAVLLPRAGDEAASRARVDRLVQWELSRLLADRGLLVVEREALDQALAQSAIAAMVGDEQAVSLGQMLDAQALIVGSVAAAGADFVVQVRALDSRTGAVLGASGGTLPRQGVVTLADDAVELRTPEEALFRSLVAPGWGQLYQRRNAAGVLVATGFYGAALVAAGSAAGGALRQAEYERFDARDPAASGQVVALRDEANTLYTVAAVSASVAGAIWALGALDAFVGD